MSYACQAFLEQSTFDRLLGQSKPLHGNLTLGYNNGRGKDGHDRKDGTTEPRFLMI
jgi:hypothetical protein